METLAGKKLLILAGSVHECDLVRRARELGIFTIVTDYYNPDESPAKKIANEYWDISWADTDALEKRCIEEGVDGITAGYSESTIDALIKICQRLDLPCYCTAEQLEILKDKKRFKELCRRNGVPVVREYKDISDVKTFPVIVKPVDRGGSIGVGVATDLESLKVAYDYAMTKSYCKEVIIEDFIKTGIKFDAYYVVIDGNIIFLSSSDTVNAAENGFEKVIQSGWILPSRYQNQYLSEVDQSMKRMIEDLGINSGFLFVSGFWTKEGFVFFETGFRLSGGHMYRYFKANGMPDIQDIFIKHALSGTSEGFSFEKHGNLKALVVNYYAKKGVLTEETGWEEINEIKECGFILPMSKVGTECYEDKAILTKLGMVHLYSSSKKTLLDSLEKVNGLYKARNQFGKDMVFDRMSKSTVSDLMDE